MSIFAVNNNKYANPCWEPLSDEYFTEINQANCEFLLRARADTLFKWFDMVQKQLKLKLFTFGCHVGELEDTDISNLKFPHDQIGHCNISEWNWIVIVYQASGGKCHVWVIPQLGMSLLPEYLHMFKFTDKHAFLLRKYWPFAADIFPKIDEYPQFLF